MKYIIMCGTSKKELTGTDTPKQLLEIKGEIIVGRTIRLLRENGVEDIAISTNDHRFAIFGVPMLKHENTGYWVNGFYPMDEPVCYLFGDVVFSKDAIKQIVATDTDSVQFFASAPPFADNYPKKWAEPFAFKVRDNKLFKDSIEKTKEMAKQGIWRREPIAWELWQVIKGTSPNHIDYKNYHAINDFTCDIDNVRDLEFYNLKLSRFDKFDNNLMTRYMIHTYPKRLWYVNDYLLPSMLAQGIDKDHIIVYNDSKGEGNLRACMNAFSQVENNSHGTWHLQDDVLICKNFKTLTESVDFGLVAGFSSRLYDGMGRIGAVKATDMWFSFPCIRIPNQYARECSEWVQKYIIGNFVYEKYWKDGVNDDWAFRTYIKEFHKDDLGINLAPNLVNHVDYLLGGGSGKGKRQNPCVSQYWEDDDLVVELEKKLANTRKE